MNVLIFCCVITISVVHSRVTDDSPHSRKFTPLVVGGERAGLGRLSFVASLSLPPAKDKRYHFCGGALISPTHVLTAAHCLDGSPFEVRFGSNDLSLIEPSSEILKVKRTIIHPEFDMFTMANDIAIVELATPSNQQPVLLSGWVALDTLGADSRGIVAGWGAVNPEATKYPDTMNDASVPIVSLDQCFRLYGHTLVDTTKLCISVTEGKDTCSGDSGGPLFTAHPSLPNQYVQLGVISWGSEPCGNTPAVYIRVAYYTTWISAVIPSLGRPLTWFDATNPATFDLLGPSPTPVPQSNVPTPPRITPFPTRRAINTSPTLSLTPTPAPLPTTPTSSVVEDCSCTQEHNRYGSDCDIHDNDPLGAWCWVGDSCSSAVLTWWGAKYVYCVLPDDISPPSGTIPATVPAVATTAEVLLAQNWSMGVPDTWRVVDKGGYMAPSVWTVGKDDKQPVLRQSSNIMVLEPRADLPKQGTYLVYTPGTEWSDYEVSLNLASTDNDILGVMFRYVDDKNYYRFSMDRQAPTTSRRLVRCLAGVFTLLASDDIPYTVGMFYLVTITVQLSRLQVMVNGQKAFDLTDDSFPSGSVALYSWANQDAIFDTVLVSRPGSIATRRLVQPIYGRAVSSQQQLHDELGRPETTNEEGDYNFEQSDSSPQALTIGLIVSLVVVLGMAAFAVYFWRKKRSHDTAKDIEIENEGGEATRIKVVTIRSPPHSQPVAVDLDIQDTCDSPTSRTSLHPDSGASPPLPSWPHPTDRNVQGTPERRATRDKNLRGRSPASRTSPCKTARPPPLPQTGTFQPPISYSLKKHQTARLSPHKAPSTVPRGARRQDPCKLQGGFESPQRYLETPSNARFAELRQRPLRSPEPTSTPPLLPEILTPSPVSSRPELPPFPTTDFCLPDVPECYSQHSESLRNWRGKNDLQREDTENSKHAGLSPSRTPVLNHSLELSPLGQDLGQPQPRPSRYQPQPEAWEEIRFGDESDGSDEGMMEYFDER